jgi:GNAT superfamily N-acetyltransferase
MSLEELVHHYARVHGVRVIAVDKMEYVEIQVMEVPEHRRGRGVGTHFMIDICAEADRRGEALGLSPEGSTANETDHLKSWYSRFGFIENQDSDNYPVSFLRFASGSYSVRPCRPETS